MANYVGPMTSHSQDHKLASALPADTNEDLQLSQRNDRPEPAIAKDCSLQSTLKGKFRLLIREMYFWNY